MLAAVDTVHLAPAAVMVAAVAAHGLAAASRDERLVAGRLRVEGGQRRVVLGVVDAAAGVGRGRRAAARGTRRTGRMNKLHINGF